MSNVINKTATKWTNEELIQWGKGEAEAGTGISVKAVAREAVARLGLEDGDIDAVKAQIAAEAVAAAETVEEEGPTVQTDAEGNQAVVFTQKPFDLNKNIAPTPDKVEGAGVKLSAGRSAADVKAAAAKAREGLTAKVVEEGLNEYIAKMTPGVPHTGEDGPKAQTAFFRIIQSIFRQSGKDFIESYSLLLDTVAKHRNTVFNERYVYRYMSEVRLTNTERKNFERILNLFLVTCDKASRKQHLKQVDLNYTVEGFNDTALIQKLTEFYSM